MTQPTPDPIPQDVLPTEPVAEAAASKAHSTWRYTGEALGTVMPGGVPLATITEAGQTVDAADATTAQRMRDSGLFKYVSGTRLPKESE